MSWSELLVSIIIDYSITVLVSTGSVDFCGISDLYTVLHGNPQ